MNAYYNRLLEAQHYLVTDITGKSRVAGEFFFHTPKFREFLGLPFQKSHTSKSRAAGEKVFHTPKFREFPAPQNSY